MPAESGSAEFDYELRTEESRRLRRRFLWYCALNLLLSLPFIPFAIRASMGQGREAHAARVMLAATIITTVPFAWAFVYILRRHHMKRDAVARLTMLLCVVCGCVGLVFSRVNLSLQSDSFRVPAEEAVRNNFPPPNATTAQVQIEQRQQYALKLLTDPAVLWGATTVFSIFFLHFISSALIPWTLRESAVTAGAFVALQAVVVGWDMIVNDAPKWLQLVTFGSAIMVLPGLIVCWWRQSQFRRQFRLKYESKHYRKLQDELQYARQVHDACLSPPVTSGAVRFHYVYEPMRQIGGDFVFVHRQPGAASSALSVLLLDVTGHGIAAALTVNRIVMELQRLFIEMPDASPADVLRVLNQYVHLTLANHALYATGICMKIDAVGQSMQWANAGHPAAFFLRGNGRIEQLESTAMMLGVEPWSDGEVEVHRMSFCAGDAVIAYTDGAIEASNETGDALGMEGIRRIIEEVSRGGTPASDWPAAILQRVRDHRPAPPEDDLLVATAFCAA